MDVYAFFFAIAVIESSESLTEINKITIYGP